MVQGWGRVILKAVLIEQIKLGQNLAGIFNFLIFLFFTLKGWPRKRTVPISKGSFLSDCDIQQVSLYFLTVSFVAQKASSYLCCKTLKLPIKRLSRKRRCVIKRVNVANYVFQWSSSQLPSVSGCLRVPELRTVNERWCDWSCKRSNTISPTVTKRYNWTKRINTWPAMGLGFSQLPIKIMINYLTCTIISFLCPSVKVYGSS